MLQAKIIAQEHLFEDNKVNGLPALECYNIHQDKRGYIWLSTETGLCRFNGKTLKNYTSKKGFNAKTCYGICEDKQGKLWFIAKGNDIFYYDEKNDSICAASFNAQLESFFKGHDTEQLYFIQADDQGNLILCSQWMTFIINTSTGKINKQSGSNSVYYFQEGDHSFYPVKYFINAPEFHYVDHNNITLGVIHGDTSYYKLNCKIKDVPQWRCLTTINKAGDKYIGWDSRLITISREGKLSIFETGSRILSVYLDKDDELWVGTLKNGVFHFQKGNTINPIHSLSKFSVSGILEDSEKGIWCSTLEHGIYYCKDKRLISYANLYEENKTEQLFKPIGNNIFCYANNSTLFSIGKNAIQAYPFKINSGLGISDLIKYKTNYLITNLENVLMTNSNFQKGKVITEENTNFSLCASKIAISSNHRIFLLQKSSLLEVDKTTLKIKRRIYNLKTNALCMLPYKNQLFIGSEDGLYQTDIDSLILTKIKDVEGPVTKLLEKEDGTIVICTKYKGIYTLKNHEITPIILKSAFEEIQFFDICLDKDTMLWVATNIGIAKVNIKKPYPLSFYNTDNGLPSNQIYKVEYVDGNLFCATSEGLFSFPYHEELLNANTPRIYLDNIVANQKVITKTETFDLAYDYSNLSVEVSPLTFKNSLGARIFYTIAFGKGNKFTSDTTTSSIIQLNNLAPNDYRLSVYAINNSNVISKNPVVIYFTIKKPFWQTLWFYLIAFVVLGIIIYFIIKAITNRIKTKEEEKTKINKLIAEYQLSALQAQMNPHFVFNAINSIQGYILNKDEQLAYDYLAKFSKLIRMVLNYSLEKTVVLKNELEMLELYIELEQLRFDNSFKFELQIDESVSLYEFQIPTMLIQPYIENAIWHGLMNLPENKKGVLKMSVNYHEDNLYVTIEDNGIGREAAKLYSKSNHNSVGMKLTEQRIVMLNQIQDYEKAKVMVSDLYDQEIACGTKVEIIIPVA